MAKCEEKHTVLKALLFLLALLAAFLCGRITVAAQTDGRTIPEGVTYVAGEDSAVFGGSLPNTMQAYVITQKNGWRWIVIQQLSTGDFSVIPFLDGDGNQVNVAILDPQPEDSELLN